MLDTEKLCDHIAVYISSKLSIQSHLANKCFSLPCALRLNDCVKTGGKIEVKEERLRERRQRTKASDIIRDGWRLQSSESGQD